MIRVALLLAVVACSNLPPVADGTCGNGVLDPGEDCDNPGDSSCIACSVACSSDADCAAHLPAPRNGSAYLCGYDRPQRLCHAPGGSFVERGDPRPYDVLGFGVADMDGDHIGDAVGLSGTQALLRYGDPTTPLAVENEAVLPTLQGPPAVGDINQDQVVDIVMPTRDGLVAYIGAQGALVPYLLSTLFSGGVVQLEARHSVQLDDQYSVVFFAVGSTLMIAPVSVTQGAQAGGMAPDTKPLCDQMFDPSKFDAISVASYDVSAVYGSQPTLMIALESERTDGTTELCALTVHEMPGALPTDPPTFTITTVMTSTVTPSGRPTLANLDAATTCPSLVRADRSRYAASTGVGTCLLAGSAVALADAPMAPSLDRVVGRAPLVPAIGGMAADALVLEGGVESYNPSTNQLSPLYVADSILTTAAFGDFNADGKIDVAASDGQSGFDVLYRVTSSTNGILFVRQRLGTQTLVRSVLAGDFDGNGASDVLAVEGILDAGHDVIAIAYGTRDQVLAPVNVDAFEQVLSAARVQLFDSSDEAGVVDDLAVIERRTNVPTTLLGLFHGTPQRVLIPYLDPRPGTPQSPSYQSSSFTTVINGHFVTSDPSGAVDLVAISASDGPVASTIWRLAGSGPGIVSAPAPNRSTFASVDAGHCGFGPPLPTFCTDGAQFAAFPLGDHDVVVGLDAVHGYAVVIDPAQITGNPFSAMQTLPLTPGPQIMTDAIQVTSLVLADSDGDGTLELIFAYTSKDPTHPGDVKSCTVSASGLDCSRDLFANEPLLAGQCVGVAKGAVTLQGQTADSGPQASLVLLCNGGIVRLDHAADGYHAAPLLEGAFMPTFFAVADVTGDLIPDFVILEARSLRVFQQCTSRGCP